MMRHRSCLMTPINPRYPALRIKLHENQRFRFGRHNECEQSFPSDFRISGVHSTLLVREQPDSTLSFVVEDSSVNGTFVNGARVPRNSQRTLASGDEIFLVIPSQKLLQHGYTGSLTTNFVGYFFEYKDADMSLRVEDKASWRRSLNVAPAAALDAPAAADPPQAVITPRQLERDHEVRQTSDVPSWLHALAEKTPRPSEDLSKPSSSREEISAPGRPGEDSSPRAASFTLWWLQQPELSVALPIR